MDEGKTNKQKQGILIAIIFVLILVGAVIVSVGIFYNSSAKGYKDYTVQMEQYYVEYSEEYDYSEVITVEYPCLEGIDDEVQAQINQLIYDTAMDRVNYWHLEPSDDVKAFQEEYFSIFASDVNCDVTYHSQYLISMDFCEYYSAGNPIWMKNGTERALTVDLLTGEIYALDDVLEINTDFIKLWDQSYSDDLDMEYGDDEDIDLLLSWFLQEDDAFNGNYICSPFFYITEDKEFVIGVALDPVLEYAYTYEPTNLSFYTQLSIEELEAFKIPGEFWDKYEKSETAGEVLSCVDKKENIWLGEDASVWDWDYNY